MSASENTDTQLALVIFFDGEDDQAKQEFLASQKYRVILFQLAMAKNDDRVIGYTVDGRIV